MKTIRTAYIEDAQNILDIYSPYVIKTAYTFETEIPSLSDFKQKMSETISKFPWLVCEVDGAIVGYAYSTAFKNRCAYSWTVETSVYVKEGMQRLEIGGSLYEALLCRLKEMGIVNAIAVITIPNEASERFHERFGFEKVGHLKKVGYKFGKWTDVGYWQCTLASK